MTLIGYGEAARLEISGKDRFTRAQDWMNSLVDHAHIDDQVQLPGTGLVCFGSFTFDTDSDQPNTLIVPNVIFGTNGSTSWMTVIGSQDRIEHQSVITPERVRCTEEDTDQYLDHVSQIVQMLSDGRANKVVLSSQMLIETANQIDERELAYQLAEAFPSTWVYCVDSLIGATPEMLASVRDQQFTTRVLAGSWPTTYGHVAAREALATSDKDIAEHEYAKRSVFDALQAHVTDIKVEGPYMMNLPNVVHYATDMTATLQDGTTGLLCAGDMHPTAAVGGTPQDVALDIISEIETHDRGRYGAPVGWMDSHGNSDWALALRCAHIIDSTSALAWAGGGIMVDSKPEVELAEIRAKFSAILSAFNK